MALVQETKYAAGIAWSNNQSQVKANRTLSGLNCSNSQGVLNDDLQFIGQFVTSLTRRMAKFSNLTPACVSVSKEMPWQPADG